MEDFKNNQFRLKALLKWNEKAWSAPQWLQIYPLSKDSLIL